MKNLPGSSILAHSPKLSVSETLSCVVGHCGMSFMFRFKMSNFCNQLVFSSVLNLKLKHYKHHAEAGKFLAKFYFEIAQTKLLQLV